MELETKASKRTLREAVGETCSRARKFLSRNKSLIVNIGGTGVVATAPFLIFPTLWPAIPLASGGLFTFALTRVMKLAVSQDSTAIKFSTYASGILIGALATGFFTLTSFYLHGEFGPGEGSPAVAVKRDARNQSLKPGDKRTAYYKGKKLPYVVKKINSCKRGILNRDFDKISLKYYSNYKGFWWGEDIKLARETTLTRPAKSAKKPNTTAQQTSHP